MKGRETKKFTHIDYLYILENVIIELPQVHMQLPEQGLLVFLLISEVPQRPTPKRTRRVCHGWTRVH